MPRLEVPDILDVAEAKDPGAEFGATCAAPGSVADPATDVMPDWPDDNTV